MKKETKLKEEIERLTNNAIKKHKSKRWTRTKEEERDNEISFKRGELKGYQSAIQKALEIIKRIIHDKGILTDAERLDIILQNLEELTASCPEGK